MILTTRAVMPRGEKIIRKNKEADKPFQNMHNESIRRPMKEH
jgi:hypothetical protein